MTSAADNDRPTAAPDPELARLYAAMLAGLEQQPEGDKVGDIFARLRESGESRSLPVAEDDEIVTLLTRLGVAPPKLDRAGRGKVAEEFVRRLAEAAGRTPAQVSLVLKLYTGGAYGLIAKPICGSPPRCRVCTLTKQCDYFNAPPKSAENLPPLRRLQREGAESLGDEELLTLVLGGSRMTEEHKNSAKALLQHFGSLRAIFAASYGEFTALRHMSENQAARLTALSALQRRADGERRAIRPQVRCGKDFYDLFHAAMRDLRQEVFIVALLDQKNRVFKDVRVSAGTLTDSLVHPREVFSPALREGAAAVAFIHNHPSGDSTPSPQDKLLTRRLCATAEVVGLRVLDHIIIGEGVYTSFVDEGLMPTPENSP